MSWLADNILILAGGAGAACWLLRRSKATPPAAIPKALPEDRPKIIGDRFRILNEEELIYELGLAPTIANIKSNLGLSGENWHKDALPLIHNFIRFVQRLPASESHHHAGDGGLVKHTLDVAAMALLASNAKSWPPGAKTEEIARLTSVWRYGILTAALLHDIGKVLTSYDIELYDNPNSKDYMLWVPDTGKMEETGRRFYRVLFPEHKTAYDVHKTLGWTFFQIIVPAEARRWMGDSDPELIRTLRAYLSGCNEQHPMAQIIRQADMTSTARDLRVGSRQRFATAKRTPLIEIVMETLKEMLHERGAYFSVAVTAGGDIFRKGNSVFVMAKNVPDKIRDFLEKHHPDTAASFPSDNQRIFDTLLEYGAVLPAPHDESKAVANVEIRFERNDGEVKNHLFSVLQFNLHTLYPEEPYPAEFLGSLEVLTHAVKQPKQVRELAGTPDIAAEDDAGTVAVQTDTATSETGQATISSLPENYVIPEPPKARKETAPKSEPTPASVNSIDDFLMQHNLLAIPDEEEIAPKSETLSEAVPDIPANNMEKAAATADNAGPSETAATVLHHEKQPSETIAKPVPTLPQNNKKMTTGAIKNLFADSKPKTAAASDSVQQEDAAIIPATESAEAGLVESRKERDSRPALAPRPVEVFKGDSPEMDQLFRENGTPPKHKPNKAMEEKKLALQAEGKRFLSWLADSLADGSISINQNDSMVHFIEQGMILVTPLVFKTYTGGFFDKSNPTCPGLLAQQGFLAVGWHERHNNSAIFHAYADGKFLFNCLLIPERNIRFLIRPGSRPANNTDLSVSDKRAPSNLGRLGKS